MPVSAGSPAGDGDGEGLAVGEGLTVTDRVTVDGLGAAVTVWVVVVLVSIEEPANLPSGVGQCGAAALVRKHEFRPALLRELWAAHGS